MSAIPPVEIVVNRRKMAGLKTIPPYIGIRLDSRLPLDSARDKRGNDKKDAREIDNAEFVPFIFSRELYTLSRHAHR